MIMFFITTTTIYSTGTVYNKCLPNCALGRKHAHIELHASADAQQQADRNRFNQLKHAIVRGDLAAVVAQLNELHSQPPTDKSVVDVAPPSDTSAAQRLVNLRIDGESSLLHV